MVVYFSLPQIARNIVRGENTKFKMSYLNSSFVFPAYLTNSSHHYINGGCFYVDLRGFFCPSWSAYVQKQSGLDRNRSGNYKVVTFAPAPGPLEASERISDEIRALMGSLWPHFPLTLAASTACSVFAVGQ